jgi:hypothetical protein
MAVLVERAAGGRFLLPPLLIGGCPVFPATVPALRKERRNGGLTWLGNLSK